VSGFVAELLDDHRLKVLVYSGQFDLICASLGTERWLDAMPWSRQHAYQAAERMPWGAAGGSPADATAGFVQREGLLRRVLVAGAGHYVPYDQPRNSAEMVRRFLLAEE